MSRRIGKLRKLTQEQHTLLEHINRSQGIGLSWSVRFLKTARKHSKSSSKLSFKRQQDLRWTLILFGKHYTLSISTDMLPHTNQILPHPRFIWCLERHIWTVGHWINVLWRDESHYILFKLDGVLGFGGYHAKSVTRVHLSTVNFGGGYAHLGEKRTTPC